MRNVMRSFLRSAGLICVVAGAGVVLEAQSAKALESWSAYIASTEARIAGEVADSSRFLTIDRAKSSAEGRDAVLAGRIVIAKIAAIDDRASSIKVDDGLIHDWVGAVFVPNVTLDELLYRLQFTPPESYQDDVLASSVLARGENTMTIAIKLERTKVITAVFNTVHDVVYRRLSPAHAVSTSRATKISELADPFTPKEREKRPGDDRGLLWRWNAYWRYESVENGVIVECESISLSRTVPLLLKPFLGGVIESTAREAMERTLVSIRDRMK